jgi:drug/metabolite transporter (DMT)-like permease/ribosomal protein S18 acetylase RimI-like enzyme
MLMNKQYKADSLLLLITVFWAAGCLLMKIGLNDLQPFNLVAVRFFISVATTGVIFYKRILRADFKTVKLAFVLAIVLFGVFMTATYGIRDTTVSNAGFLTAIPVAFVPIYTAVLFRQRPDGKTLTGIVLTVVGVALLTVNGSFSINAGDWLCILCSLIYAFYMILIDKFTPQVDAIALSIIQFAFVGAFCLAFSAGFETMKLPTTTQSWLIVLALSVLSTSAAFIIQAMVQQDTTPVHAGIIFGTEPLFTAMLAFVFLGEELNARGYLGGVILLLGVFVIEFDWSLLKKIRTRGETGGGRVEIIDFVDGLHADFKRISHEWLEEYDLLAPEDEEIINDPWGLILAPGGYIYFARYGVEIVGTASLIKVDDTTFELAKFAVVEQYKGRKIGSALLEKCLDTAKREKAQKLILYTSSKLTPAIELYKKFGFTELPVINTKYTGADVKMEMNI